MKLLINALKKLLFFLKLNGRLYLDKYITSLFLLTITLTIFLLLFLFAIKVGKMISKLLFFYEIE